MAYSFVHVRGDGPRPQPMLDRHNRGDKRPATALGRAEFDGVASLEIVNDERRAKAVVSALRAAMKAERRPGRPPSAEVRLMLGHPPIFEAPEAWPRSQLESWARDCAGWLKGHLERASQGQAIVSRVDLHVDETRPHLHVTVVPRMPRKGRDDAVRESVREWGPDAVPACDLTFSWKRLQLAAWPGTPAKGKNAIQVSGVALQSSFYEEVGRRYGMARGEPSAKTRSEPDAMRGLLTRARLADERADRDRRSAAAAAERSDRASRRVRRSAAAERQSARARGQWERHALRVVQAENRTLRAALTRALDARDRERKR